MPTLLCDGYHDSLKLDTSLGSAEPIQFKPYRNGTLYFPVGFTTATLTFHGCPTQDGTYTACQDEDGNPITLASCVAGSNRPIPTAVFGCHWLKIVSSVDNTSVIVDLTVKS